MKNKRTLVVAGIAIALVIGGFYYFNSSNRGDSLVTSDGYLLQVPNLNFEIIFPAEPQFNRTDGDDFTRHSWSYIDNSPEGRVGLFVQAENNLYAYNSSQEDFIEQTAKIYGGVVSRMEKDPNIPAIDYEITGVYSNSSPDTETIVGRIVDVGDWTLVITNQFEEANRYPDFIQSLKVTR
jgi:hypothetical protein